MSRSFSELFPSRFLKKEDVPHRIVATIQSITEETVKTDHGNEGKNVINLSGMKPMILNKGNATVLYEAYGEPIGWPGKQVEVYADPNVMFGGKRVGGLRLAIPVIPQQGFGTAPVQGTNGVWLFEQATAEAAKVGITRDELVAHLKSMGLSGYQGSRDTRIVQDMIAIRRLANQAKQQSFGSQDNDPMPPSSGDQIPFAWLVPMLLPLFSIFS